MNKTIETLDKNARERAAIQCIADYGTDTSKTKAKHICPKDVPICNDYIPGKFLGICGKTKAPNKLIDFVFLEPRPKPPPESCSWTVKEKGFDYPDNDMNFNQPPSGKCVPNTAALLAAGNPNLDIVANNGCKNYTTKETCGPIGTMCPACCTWQATLSLSSIKSELGRDLKNPSHIGSDLKQIGSQVEYNLKNPSYMASNLKHLGSQVKDKISHFF